MSDPICVISGAGPGTGAAMARRFAAGGYRVMLLARNAARLSQLAADIPRSQAFACDVTDAQQVAQTAKRILDEIGTPKVLIHNAVGGTFGTFQEIDPQALERNFQVNVMGLLSLARQFSPAMQSAGNGAIIATGNTSAYRGKANFAGFAPTKAAQRILAESMARDLGPKGIHVAYVVIDAVINVPWTQERFNKDGSKPEDFFIQPRSIAEEVWHVAHQDRNAWSFNVEVRPYAEQW
jgi:short-subunit dehydrogenase